VYVTTGIIESQRISTRQHSVTFHKIFLLAFSVVRNTTHNHNTDIKVLHWNCSKTPLDGSIMLLKFPNSVWPQ